MSVGLCWSALGYLGSMVCWGTVRQECLGFSVTAWSFHSFFCFGTLFLFFYFFIPKLLKAFVLIDVIEFLLFCLCVPSPHFKTRVWVVEQEAVFGQLAGRWGGGEVNPEMGKT